MEPMKAGLIGCGNISDTYLQMAPRFAGLDIVACADIMPEAAAAKAAEYNVAAKDVAAMLADPEIELLINLTVPNAHAEVTQRALDAGKHVYSEKPLAATFAGARQIAETAARTGRRVGCAPDTFLGGGHQRARRLVDDGVIGRPVGATALFLSPGMESWHPNPDFFFKPGGGPVLDVGPYYIAALVNLMGPVRRVTSSATISHPERTITSEPLKGTKIQVEVPTHVSGTLEFHSGALAAFMASWDVQRHAHNPIEIYGTAASLIVPDPNFFGGDCKVGRSGSEWESVGPDGLAFAEPNWTTSRETKVANHRIIGALDMAYAIRADRPHRANLEFALHTLEIIEALATSAQRHTHVDVESTCERPAAVPAGTGEDVFRYEPIRSPLVCSEVPQ